LQKKPLNPVPCSWQATPLGGDGAAHGAGTCKGNGQNLGIALGPVTEGAHLSEVMI